MKTGLEPRWVLNPVKPAFDAAPQPSKPTRWRAPPLMSISAWWLPKWFLSPYLSVAGDVLSDN